MAYVVKNDILNDVLKALSQTKRLSIKIFLEHRIGITKPEVIEFYEMKLEQDGYANYFTLPDKTKSFFITSVGLLFYKNGGYKNDVTQLAKDMLNISHSIEKAKHRTLETFIQSRTDNKIKDNISTTKDKELKKTFIIDDRKKIEYVVDEFFLLIDKIESSTTFSVLELRAWEAELKSLISLAFSEEHSFFKKAKYSILDKQTLLEYYKPALHILELHFISLSTDLSNIHDLIKDKVEKLFNNGHYEDAIFQSFKAIEIAVKAKSGINKTGTALMDDVFSSRKPILRFSDDESYQAGFMFLYKGAMGSIRNKEGHNKVEYTKEEAFETINFASLLLRYLDKSEIVNKE